MQSLVREREQRGDKWSLSERWRRRGMTLGSRDNRCVNGIETDWVQLSVTAAVAHSPEWVTRRQINIGLRSLVFQRYGLSTQSIHARGFSFSA